MRILYDIEMKAEPGYVICMSACLLLDHFNCIYKCQLSLGYPYVQPLQTSPLFGIKMWYLGCFFFWVGG